MLGRRGPGAGGVHAARAEGARRARRRRRDRRPRRPRARPGQRARARGRPRARATQRRAAARVRGARARGQAAPVVLRFLVSPVAILGDERVEAIEVVRNELVDEDGRIVARADRRARDDPVRPRPAQRRLPGRRAARRAVRRAPRHDPERPAAASTGAERTYCAGWIKRGPSGVIGTNKKDATETVELLLEDARAGQLARRRRRRRSRRSCTSAASTSSSTRAGRRSTRRARPRRAARPPPGEALHLGRAAATAARLGEDPSLEGCAGGCGTPGQRRDGRVPQLRQAPRAPRARVPAVRVRRLGARRGARRAAAAAAARARSLADRRIRVAS